MSKASGVFRKWGTLLGFALGVCLIGYLTQKPAKENRNTENTSTLNNLTPIDSPLSSNNQNPSAVTNRPVATHISIQALNIEAGIRERYQELFNEIPEANLYFEFLSKSGIPEQFQWRAFRVLHDFTLRLGEQDREIETLKSRLSDKESMSDGNTDPAAASELDSIKLEIKTAIEHRRWFQEKGYEALRRFHPLLRDETLATLFRFRPQEIPFTLPHVEQGDVFLGVGP